MTIFIYNIKRILKRKLNIIFMIVVPVIFILISMAATQSGSPIAVGIVDNDNTKLTNTLLENLEDKCTIVKVNEDEITSKIISSSIQYAIVIDEGFTNSIINGEEAKVKSYSIQETDAAVPLKMYIENFINAAKNIGAAAVGNQDKFYTGMDYYQDGSFASDFKTFDFKAFSKQTTLTSLGFLIMCILFLSSFSASMILEDKKSNTYYRIFSTPIKIKSYMLQNILSFIAIAAIQIAAVIAAMKFLFKADLGPSILNLYLVMFVFGIVSVSIGIAISSLSKDTRQASTLTTFIIIPACMLGGCYWPREVMPDVLKRIGDFVPTTWALKGAEGVLNGSSILGLWKELGILVLFALVFFLLASWRKADVAK